MKFILSLFISLCSIGDGELKEISGLAVSRTHEDVIWMHNDSGDGPFLYAVKKSGKVLGKFEVTGGTSEDWEDISAGPCPDGSGECLFIGDTGDKNGYRHELSILILREPQNLKGGKLAVQSVVHFSGEGMNIESLAWVPDQKLFYVIEKKGKRSDAQARNPAMYSVSLTGEMNFVANLGLKDFSRDNEDTLVTSADYHPERREFLVGTYGRIFILGRDLGVRRVFDVPALEKAEAAGWGKNAIFVTGEEKHPELWKLSL